jgi:RNase adaptor protein for sRNA GlmZ degradation
VDIIFHWRFDCSNFRDPIGQAHLRNLDGRDAKVQAFLMEDPRFKAIVHAARMIAEEKAAWTAIAFHDFHGKYISTGLVELVGQELDSRGFAIGKSHHALVPLSSGKGTVLNGTSPR